LNACSVSDKRLIATVAGAIETHVKGQDWTAEKTAAKMIEGYKAYSQTAQQLRFTVSARKFFSQGLWLDSKLWPFKQTPRQL
jgi:fructose-1,6-bisphosphatase/inositol monophosphatase family enzyme